MLETTTTTGLHDFVVAEVLSKRQQPGGGGEALDLGGGTGALAVRLRGLGWHVTVADLNPGGFGATDVPIVQADFNDPDFAGKLGKGRFDLVTSTEVIEHVESPIGFLRNIGWLLTPGGIAVLTTPNVDSAAARLAFLVKGKVRMMDEHSEPTHISPIFWDLLMRQYLPRAGLRLVEHRVFPPEGYVHTRPQYAWALKALAKLWRGGESILGDNHILVLERAP
jgi:SAM-dependent methyltransferase